MADYKATAAQLASIANAIRLKGGTSAALEYPSEWITAIQNLTPSSGGSEITPADPTAEYKVTDTELISIANAIRAKAEISGQLEFPSEFISGINSIPDPGPQVVSWADGTGEEITALIQAAHAGTIDLQRDAGWAVGDVKTISVGSFVDAEGRTSQVNNYIKLAITSFDDYMECGCVLQFDFITYLRFSESNIGNKMSLSNTNVGGYGASDMKTTTLPALVNALPSWLQNLLIEFSCLTGKGNASSQSEIVTGNKLALRSEVEMFNNHTRSASGEGSHISYYNSNDRRKKTSGTAQSGTSSQPIWLRSPVSWSNVQYLRTESNGSNTAAANANITYSIAPFGCI